MRPAGRIHTPRDSKGPLPVSCGAPPCILLASSMGRRKCQGVERFGLLELPLGGVNTYVGVRKTRNDEFQGYTPKKTHTTGAFKTTHEAAVALAQLTNDINIGTYVEKTKNDTKTRIESRTAGAPLPLRMRSHCTVD